MSSKNAVFKFSFREEILLPKVMAIVFLQGEDEEGEEYYYYCGVNGQMLEKFYQAIQSGEPFNISDYAVVLGEGYGTPHAEHREVAVSGYLFNEHSTYATLLPERKKTPAAT